MDHTPSGVVDLVWMTRHPPIIYSHQATTDIIELIKYDLIVLIGSLESSSDVQRGQMGWISNDAIGINPPVTMRGNGPQGAR